MEKIVLGVTHEIQEAILWAVERKSTKDNRRHNALLDKAKMDGDEVFSKRRKVRR